jgi:hypothetical protein
MENAQLKIERVVLSVERGALRVGGCCSSELNYAFRIEN